jgi:hypothetical protein
VSPDGRVRVSVNVERRVGLCLSSLCDLQFSICNLQYSNAGRARDVAVTVVICRALRRSDRAPNCKLQIANWPRARSDDRSATLHENRPTESKVWASLDGVTRPAGASLTGCYVPAMRENLAASVLASPSGASCRGAFFRRTSSTAQPKVYIRSESSQVFASHKIWYLTGGSPLDVVVRKGLASFPQTVSAASGAKRPASELPIENCKFDVGWDKRAERAPAHQTSALCMMGRHSQARLSHPTHCDQLTVRAPPTYVRH